MQYFHICVYMHGVYVCAWCVCVSACVFACQSMYRLWMIFHYFPLPPNHCRRSLTICRLLMSHSLTAKWCWQSSLIQITRPCVVGKRRYVPYFTGNKNPAPLYTTLQKFSTEQTLARHTHIHSNPQLDTPNTPRLPRASEHFDRVLKKD